MGEYMGTSCGQGVSEAHSKMRTFLCIVLTAAVMADSEPYTIGQVAHGYGRGVITGVDYGNGHVSGYGAIGNRGYAGYGGYAGYSGLHGSTESVKLTVILMPTPLARLLMDTPMVSSLELTTDMAVSLAMELSVT